MRQLRVLTCQQCACVLRGQWLFKNNPRVNWSSHEQSRKIEISSQEAPFGKSIGQCSECWANGDSVRCQRGIFDQQKSVDHDRHATGIGCRGQCSSATGKQRNDELVFRYELARFVRSGVNWADACSIKERKLGVRRISRHYRHRAQSRCNEED